MKIPAGMKIVIGGIKYVNEIPDELVKGTSLEAGTKKKNEPARADRA